MCCDRLRAQFGKDILANAVHGPSNRVLAENKIKLIFGDVEFDIEGLTLALYFLQFPILMMWSLWCHRTIKTLVALISSLKRSLGSYCLLTPILRAIDLSCYWNKGIENERWTKTSGLFDVRLFLRRRDWKELVLLFVHNVCSLLSLSNQKINDK